MVFCAPGVHKNHRIPVSIAALCDDGDVSNGDIDLLGVFTM